MKSLAGSFVGLLFLLSAPVTSVYAASEPTGKKDGLSPCVVRSPATGLYYDLNAISVPRPDPSDGKKSSKNAPRESWHAKGHDYHANFTLNICAPVVEDIKDVVGVERDRWKNVSAYYEKEGKIYSIGEQAAQPLFRGRKLVLNYTNGSPCPGEQIGHSSRNKSTIMSFLCDRDALSHQAVASFVGTMDQCTYFFEVRSAAACGSIGHAHGDGLGPGGVFGVIALIAVAAYLDMFIIVFSSLGRLFRVRRSSNLGHGRADGSSGGFIGAIGGRRGRDNYASDVDAENRLIDQLDETWDD
ncbi:hypothetical protein KXW73_002860 [Aspergillus fumigatus]|nr:hypothetical protein KXW73_002860 [Aspergillus fumigatus]